MPDQPRITTVESPRLLLHAARSSDAIPLFEAFKDAEVMRYWCTPPHKDISSTEKWLNSMMTSSQNGVTDFVITLKPTTSSSASTSKDNDSNSNDDDGGSEANAVIGKIGIYAPLPSNEIGFLLSRTYWGRGLAKEALGGMLGYLFNLRQASEISSDTQTEKGGLSSQSDSESTATTRHTPHTATYTTLTHTDLATQATEGWLYPSISADVDPRNAASLRLLAGFGFEKVGVLERSMWVGYGDEGEGDGEWVDSVYLRVERGSWAAREERN